MSEKMERCALRQSFLLLALAFVVGCAAAQRGIRTTAYWSNYDAREHDWNMTAKGVYCHRWHADEPLEWRSKYNWTAFCGPVGPPSEEACGKCLKVTNLARPKAQITVRIVDECIDDREGLSLDFIAFDQIDTDGTGYLRGYMAVNYEFVDCNDVTIPLHSQ